MKLTKTLQKNVFSVEMFLCGTFKLIISLLFLMPGLKTHIEKEEYESNVITKRCGVD